jgi:eukaryotic-like serine/threonine-protein kinase
MKFNTSSGGRGEISGSLWSFGDCQFDEFSRELRVKGNPVDLESKPLDVLYQLLLHSGEVVTKEELLESAWPGVAVVESSLATAVSKLRKALGDDDQRIVLTIPRVGYRLAVPVQCKRVANSAPQDAGLKAGDSVPGRDQWQLVRRLDDSQTVEVWLAEHPKTGECRVFKFTWDGVRLKSLKREVTLSRVLRESLGERPDLVRMLEWNFDTQPFYLETEFCGPNLQQWAAERGGLEQVPLETRLRVLVDIASAVAAAHDVGVLHKDLKPANVLVSTKPEGGWQVKVADFGSGMLTEPGRLQALGITNLGFTQLESTTDSSLTGTLAYLAPEVMAGQSATASADVYALGVMLYQMAVCDFRKPVSPGWEAGVEDPLLREDIAEAACGDPARRLSSVALLVERLTTLERRRTERRELDLAQERALAAERRLAEARTRRPWVLAAIAALALGFVVSVALFWGAARERDRANRQTAIAAAMNRFLGNDLLGRSNPFQSGQSSESFLDAVKQASPSIDRQFQHEPEVAARLHQTIARTLDSRTDYTDARPEYQRAAELFLQTEGPLSQEAIVVQLQRAAMEARNYESDSLPAAHSLLSEQELRIAKIAHPREDLPVWLAFARGMVALIDNKVKSANEQFQTASRLADGLPAFDERARLGFKQRLAFTYVRLGDGAKAEQLARELITAYAKVDGPDSPNVLRVRLNLAQAFMVQSKYKEAIAETSAIYPDYVAKLGEDHELTMQLLSTRAQSEGSLELWDDSIRDDLKVYDVAAKKQGPMSFFPIATLSDVGLAQCRGGHTQEGEANARKAYDASSKAFGPAAGLTGGAAYTLATCWISLGKLQEASKLLEGIDTKVVAQLTGFPDWRANVDLARGEIAYRERDFTAAQKYLQSATPVFQRPDAEAYQKRAMETLSANLNQHAGR